VKILWLILSYISWIPLFLLVSIVPSFIKTYSAWFVDLRVGQINPGIFVAALTSCNSGVYESLVQLSSSNPDSLSASQSSSLSFGLCKSPFQPRQFSMSANSFRWTILITFGWITVYSFDFANTQYFSWASWEVLCRRSWWQRWSFPQYKCSCTIMLNVSPACFDNLFSIWNVSYSGHLLVLSARFLLCSTYILAAMQHLRKVEYLGHSMQFLLLCLCLHFKKLSVFVVCNDGSTPASNPLLARGNCLSTTFSHTVLSVVVDCLLPITSHTWEQLVSTATPCGIFENMLRATLKRVGYCECISLCWPHRCMISGIQNLLLISIRSEW